MDLTQTTPRDAASQTPALRLAGQLGGSASETLDPSSIEPLLEEARALLASLKVDKSRIEARLAEFGRTDPIAEVKGHSALDDAIASCQRAIKVLDDSLLQPES